MPILMPGMASLLHVPKKVTPAHEMRSICTHLIGANILPIFKHIVELIMTARFNLLRNDLACAWNRMLPPRITMDGAIVVHDMAARIDNTAAASATDHNSRRCCCDGISRARSVIFDQARILLVTHDALVINESPAPFASH